MLTHNLIHRSDLLQQGAGTFYNHYYEDSTRLYGLFDSECWCGQLLLEEALDAAKMGYRRQIPLLHRDLFLPVETEEQDYLNGQYYIPAYGDEDLFYGGGSRYGAPEYGPEGAVALPAGVVDVDCCCDLAVDPKTVLLKNADFELKNGYIVFRQNLFDLMPSQGESPNRRLTLWLRSAYSDRSYVQERLGILTKTSGKSTQKYKDFCNKIMDCIAEGTNRWRLNQLIGLLYDIACTEERETVEQTGVFRSQRFLATDKRVYWAPMQAAWIYSPGDTLPPGTFLTDALTETSSKHLPADVPLFVPQRFLGSGYKAGLVFPNSDVQLQWNPATGRLTFPLTGNYEDIARFWDMFYSRISDSGMLYSASEGGWLNPAQLFYKTFLYPRLRFYAIDLTKTGRNPLPVVNTQVFRELLPPGILFSLQTAAAAAEQNYTPDIKYDTVFPAAGMKPAETTITNFTFNVQIKPC